MTAKQNYYETISKTIIQNLNKRGMDGFYFQTHEECLLAISEQLPKGSTIAWGGSETLHDINLFSTISKEDFHLIDRQSAKTPEESRAIYSQTVLADYFFMSTNAITIDGELINVDGSGNRVACLIHGPKYVYIIAGMNKITKNVETAIARTRNQAAPPNAKRLNRQTPCHFTGHCNDCLSPDCMCNQTVITRRSGIPGRIKVFLIGEELGF